MAQLLDTRSAACAPVTLVCDNLNTHTKGAFYEAFPPDTARGSVQRIDFCDTPKHGSWLRRLNAHRAECEWSCLTSQCLTGRRIGERMTRQQEIKRRADKTNATQRGGDGPFKITDAHTKRNRL